MGRVLDFNANSISDQTTKDIKRVFGDINTITYDNGSEFSAWKLTESTTNSTIFFSDPYTPRQRGVVSRILCKLSVRSFPQGLPSRA